jgi:pyruvate/2-oxoglutarate dehydrogenase complex dihydrolipoamide dehydrogenase (E3) component
MPRFTPLEPLDEHNRTLESNVHPPDWVNPRPDGRYNLVVVGAGTAGLVAAAGAAGLGAKVALVERELMGGDCLNVGCVPSKAVIAAARVARSVRDADGFGVTVGEVSVDFPRVMERMRRLRAGISPTDSARRFRELGVDVYLGQGVFVGSDTLRVDGETLRFQKAVIATGARAGAPPIPGLDGVGYLTNETLFSLTELPRRLGIIGAGPIGCEMAQAFALLGSEVHLVESSHGILPREEPEASQIVEQALKRDGVRVRCCGKRMRVEASGATGARLEFDSHGQHHAQTVDALLVAAGRSPNVEDLGLETIGVTYDLRSGVEVDDRLRTTHPRVYAAGDVCSAFRFTHAADFMARIVIQNALFLGRSRASALTIPWSTYTWPEIAHVGLTPRQAHEGGVEIDSFTQDLGEVDRAVLEGEDEGFARIHVKRRTDRIVGSTIVAAHAGEMIAEVSLAMTHGLGLKKLGSTIHPYPTRADALRRLGDQFNRTRLTPRVRAALARWLAWTR